PGGDRRQALRGASPERAGRARARGRRARGRRPADGPGAVAGRRAGRLPLRRVCPAPDRPPRGARPGGGRGAALADYRFDEFAQPEIARLEELRMEAVEERLAAELAGGGGEEVVGELQVLVAQHPLRERLRGQLMGALYAAG